MKETFLNYIVCPACRGRLSLASKQTGVRGEIRSGSLDCSHCRREYPIRNYIPRFATSDNYASSFGLEWKRHARTQLDTYSGTDITRQRFIRTTGWPDRLEGQLILEGGCGAGRFTEVVLQTGAELVSFDLSEAVDSCLENQKLPDKLHIFQGDIYRLPLKSSLFDKVFCLGVLQHCPDVPAAFQNLLPPLKPGGELAIDIYERNFKIFLAPRFWLRLVTSRMRPELLYSIVERSVPRLLPLKTWLKEGVPLLGRYLAIAIPIAYYKGVYPLSEKQLIEWSVLDTFDILAPRYENRAGLAEVRSWFTEAGLANIRVDWGGNGIIGLALKPSETASSLAALS